MTYNSAFPYTEFKPVSTSRRKRKQKDTLPSVVRSLREQLGEGEWFTQCSSYVKHQNSHFKIKKTFSHFAFRMWNFTSLFSMIISICNRITQDGLGHMGTWGSGEHNGRDRCSGLMSWPWKPHFIFECSCTACVPDGDLQISECSCVFPFHLPLALDLLIRKVPFPYTIRFSPKKIRVSLKNYNSTS